MKRKIIDTAEALHCAICRKTIQPLAPKIIMGSQTWDGVQFYTALHRQCASWLAPETSKNAS